MGSAANDRACICCFFGRRRRADLCGLALWEDAVKPMNNRARNAIVNDAGHVSDIAEAEHSAPRASGVRHELIQDGLCVCVREVWYWIDTREERAADEVLMPINDLVHMVVNTTPEERRHLASVRTTVPTSDWSDVQQSMNGLFEVTRETSQGLEKGVVKWVADEETGVELLRLLTAYQRGADRGELKAFLDVRRPI